MLGGAGCRPAARPATRPSGHDPLFEEARHAHRETEHSGEVVATYTDGKSETCRQNDLFYRPPGHSVRVVDDAEVILFSPIHAHNEALDHMLRAMSA